MLKTLKSIFSILSGIITLIFVYAFKLFFLVTSVVSLIIMGYTFINCINYMNGGSNMELAICSVIVYLNVIYLYITLKLGVGMHDILLFIHQVMSIINPKNSNEATSEGSNTVVGSKGVFKR